MKCFFLVAISTILFSQLAMAGAGPGSSKADTSIPQQSGANVVYQNFDGSITIENPRVMYGGRLQPIFAGSFEVSGRQQCLDGEVGDSDFPAKTKLANSSMQGACARAGRQEMKAFKTASPKKMSTTAIALTSDGGFSTVVSSTSEKYNILDTGWTARKCSFVEILSSVTCK